VSSRSLLALFVLLVPLASAWTACAPPPRPVSAATVAAPTASVRARVGAPLRVATSGEYPPLSSWKGDRPDGFAPALLEAFAATEKRDLAWSRFRWPDLVADMRAGRFEIAADGITVRPERSVAGRFTVPIARGGAVLLLRRPTWAGAPGSAEKQDPLAAVRAIDRTELRVVVNAGGHLERVTRALLRSANVRAIADNASVRDALARGEADAAMTNTFEAPRWSEGLADVERIGPLSRDVTALWIHPDREALAERLDTWLLAEEESGALGALRSRSLGAGAGGPTARAVDALVAATAERLALMPLVAAAKQRTGKAVEDPAQEERVIAGAVGAVAKASAFRGTAPPPREVVEAFFRVQIEAAKVVQERARPTDAVPATAPSYSLPAELRPAIARITARMAFLVVRVPRETTRVAVIARAREDLADTGLATDQIDKLATAIAALAAGP
jgi:cyclohexadienyl dehydratase